MKLLLDTQLDILPAVFDHLPKGVSIAGQNTPAHVMSEELGVPVIEATYDGTGGDDTYTGTSGDDTINGYGGNDTLAGAGGADTIDGGDGGDILYSANVSPAWNPSYYYIAPVIPVLDTGTEIDTIRGGTGYDTIFAGYGDNVDGGADSANLLISFQGATSGVTADFNLLSNNGTMVIGGGAITNVNWVRWVDGSNYDDVITASTSGNGGSTDVRGLGGNDTLIAGYYGGNLYGGDGDDTLDGRQTLYGGYYYGEAGDDTIYTVTASSAAFGGDGNDKIVGVGILQGDSGNDRLTVTSGGVPTYVYGGAGDDQIDASAATFRVIATGGAGADTIRGSGYDDMLFSSAADSSPGSIADANAIDNGAEHDTINAGGGNDLISAGYGDSVDGGTGVNTLVLSFGGATSGVTFDATALIGGGSVTIGGGTITNIQNIQQINGTAFDDAITLPTMGIAATIYGGAGNDQLVGGNSAVTFYGGDGNDTLTGGSAADTFYGGLGADIISAGGGDDTIYISAGDIAAGEMISGGDGVDAIYAQGGSVDLSGVGISNVERISGSGLTLATSQFSGLLSLSFSTLTLANAGTVLLSGVTVSGSTVNLSSSGNTFDMTGATFNSGSYYFTVNGGNGDDVITTLDGRDLINGGAGDDTLNAGDGDDTLVGGIGRDTFHGGNGNDTILVSAADFASGEIYDGGAGTDMLRLTGTVDISSATLTSIETLGVDNYGSASLTGAQLQSLSTIAVPGYSGFGIQAKLYLTTGGTFAYSGSGQVPVFNLAAADTNLDLSGMTYAESVVVVGGVGNDTVVGSNFADSLTGGAGRDELHGGAGDDTISVTTADYAAGEIYDGGTGSDTLVLGANVDISTSTVTAIEQVIINYQGSASMTGAQLQGFSRISSSYYSPETINLTTGGAVSFTGSSDQQLVFNLAASGTAFDLSGLTSTATAATKVVVTGGAGNDTITGSNYADQLRGGDGLDVFHGGGGDDVVVVSGSDYVSGEIYDGGAGNDALSFFAVGSIDISAATITSFETLLYNSSPTTSTLSLTLAQLASFTVVNASTSLTLTTGGSIAFNGKTLAGTFNLAPADTVFDLTGVTLSAGSVTVNGNSGNDTLIGSASADTLNGGDGNDRLDGRGGPDQMTGGLGDDTYILDSSGDRVFENAGGGNDTIESSVTVTTINSANVETIKLTGTGNINATGTSTVANTLIGNSGNNRLDGGGGGDRMEGGAGDDTYVVRSSTDIVVEGASAGNDTVLVASNVTNFALAADAQVEKLAALTPSLTVAMNLTGNDFSHDIQGSAGDNILTGGAGNDVLQGFAGDDRLIGGGGVDTLIGGLGDDIYVIDSADDVVIELGNEGDDTIKTSVDYTLAAGVSVENLRAIGSANINITGNADHQILVGNPGDNVLDDGGAGTFDRMKGGYGNDTYIVHNAGDVIVEIEDAGTNDIVKAAVSYTLGADAWIETLQTIDASATTAIDLTGNDHTQTITGNAGANVLTGGAGNETINGLGGNDTLFGGGGADTFVFAPGTGQDTVGDFVVGTDHLDLTAFGFASFAAVQAATHDNGSGYAVIDLGNGDSVTLTGVSKAQLQSGDVTFGAQGGSSADGVERVAHFALDGVTPVLVDHDFTVGFVRDSLPWHFYAVAL